MSPTPPIYRGRFAPTPSGPLHLGSLIAALGSYLDARQQQGEWWLRIEDVDHPRVVPGAADSILRTLEAFGLLWDGEVSYQRLRYERYHEILQQLQQQGWLYGCNCSRKQLQGISRMGPEGWIYPDRCRLQPCLPGKAWRIKTPDHPIHCEDRRQGAWDYPLHEALGDFPLLRADGVVTYQLAVVVDDFDQGMTDVVRGQDLWLSTPRQRWLHHCLGWPSPRYLHLPLVMNAAGEKLSKQTRAPALDLERREYLLWQALDFLGQQPPMALQNASIAEILQWGIAHWNIAHLATPAGGLPASELGWQR